MKMAKNVLLDNEFEEKTKRNKVIPKIKGVACIFIHVKDVQKSKKWYLDNLGINFDQETPNCGEINLGLWPYPDPVPSEHALFVLETPQLADTYRIMKENGVQVDESINWNCWYFNFKDPDGNVMTMWQRDEFVVFDFGNIENVEAMHRLIKSKLYLKNSYRYDWESFSEVLLSCSTIGQRRIIADGWDSLQKRLPHEANMFLELILKHNSRFPTHHWTLELREK
jgi:predicted enzyme related to lactoylglutathione lyase